MSLMRWARLLLITGLALIAAAVAPALVLLVLPRMGDGFLGIFSLMLALSVVPFGVFVLLLAAVLALIALLRRGRA
jgi:hypothetical protein